MTLQALLLLLRRQRLHFKKTDTHVLTDMRVLLYIKGAKMKQKAANNMHISSRDNPKIKQFIKLSSSKKARRESGLFVLEGARLCKDAFDMWRQNRLDITACFATEKALEKYSDYVDQSWFTQNEQFYTVDEAIALKMSDSQYPQGIFVIVKMLDNSLLSDKIKPNGKYLILDDLQDPGNVGTLLRTAEAVGIDAVILCSDCCELYNPKVLRSAMGSALRLDIMIGDSFAQTVSVLKSKGIKVYASVIDKDAVSVTAADYSGGCAVVLGNEGNGMAQDDVNLCSGKITIRMHGNLNSLNVATAGSIILWEMCRSDNL